MNRGKFIETIYEKKVSFNSAVLWKDRQLSLPVSIVKQIRDKDIKLIRFVDEGKKEAWEFKPEKVFETMVLKREGQEPQYYFPISLKKVRKIERDTKGIKEKGLQESFLS